MLAPPPPSQKQSRALKWLNLFQNNPDVYAFQGKNGGYYCADYDYNQQKRLLLPKAITEDVLMNHFQGKKTLGMYALSPDNTCKWMCWDWDKEDEEAILRTIGWLRGYDLHPLRESRRPGRTGHLWLFFEKPVPAIDAWRIGVWSKFQHAGDIEVFPKQAAIKESHIENPGNLVRLPLGRHQKVQDASVWGWFEGCDQNVPAQVDWLLQQPLSSNLAFASLVDDCPTRQPAPKNTKAKSYGNTLLDHLPEGWPATELNTGEWQIKCPLCAEIGQDKKNSNLYIGDHGQVMFCHYNDGEHKFAGILQAFKQLSVQADGNGYSFPPSQQ